MFPVVSGTRAKYCIGAKKDFNIFPKHPILILCICLTKTTAEQTVCCRKLFVAIIRITTLNKYVRPKKPDNMHS